MIPPDVYQKGIEAVLKYLREYLPGRGNVTLNVLMCFTRNGIY
jgi:hypothetical protein